MANSVHRPPVLLTLSNPYSDLRVGANVHSLGATPADIRRAVPGLPQWIVVSKNKL